MVSLVQAGNFVCCDSDMPCWGTRSDCQSSRWWVLASMVDELRGQSKKAADTGCGLAHCVLCPMSVIKARNLTFRVSACIGAASFPPFALLRLAWGHGAQLRMHARSDARHAPARSARPARARIGMFNWQSRCVTATSRSASSAELQFRLVPETVFEDFAHCEIKRETRKVHEF